MVLASTTHQFQLKVRSRCGGVGHIHYVVKPNLVLRLGWGHK